MYLTKTPTHPQTEPTNAQAQMFKPIWPLTDTKKEARCAMSKKENSEVHGISMDEFGGTIPGVTQLLNPGLEKKQNVVTSNGNSTKIQLKFGGTRSDIHHPEKKPALSPKAAALHPASDVPQTPASLSKFGVRSVLVFQKKNGVHRFEAADSRSPEPLAPWQKEFYLGMILDEGVLSLSADFCEFNAKSSKFHTDAFGLSESEWLVLLKSDTGWYALISKNSLSTSRKDWESLFGEAASTDKEKSGEIKIEIA
jgi:hypothetical protein